MNYKIMIVEDDPDIAELVSGHLGKFGFTIHKGKGRDYKKFFAKLESRYRNANV